jgi:hypothetical protein
MSKPTAGSIRANGMVQSNTETYRTYMVAQIRIYGDVCERGSKAFEDFMRVVPRCVTISKRVGDGVEVSVP